MTSGSGHAATTTVMRPQHYPTVGTATLRVVAIKPRLVAIMRNQIPSSEHWPVNGWTIETSMIDGPWRPDGRTWAPIGPHA